MPSVKKKINGMKGVFKGRKFLLAHETNPNSRKIQ
jgi:hypothetical protein